MFNKITRQDDNVKFKELIFKAQENFPDDVEKQIKYVENNGSQQDKLLGRLTLLQMAYISAESKKIELNTKCIEVMLRGFLDTARHMQNNLPEEVYGYINKKTDSFVNEITEQVK